MVSIWGLYRGFEDAQGAVKELQGRRFEPGDISAVLLEEVARLFVNNDDVARVSESHARGNPPPPAGLDTLLAGHRPLRVPGTGPLLAIGVLGSLLGRTAANVSGASGGLEGALEDFGIPEARARLYAQGVMGRSVLLVVRAANEREAEAVAVMRRHRVAEIAGFPG